MPNTIQVKRGLEANRASVTPAAGEFLYTTDTKSVFVGDGTTAGGKQVGGSGGAYTEYLSRSTDITLILANVGRIIVEPTVSIMIQLPVATTLVEGNTFQITNISEQVNVFVKSSDGTYQAFVAAGQTVNITVENISTAAGVWVADNPNYGFSSPVSFGFTGTYNIVNINSATATISATKMIRIYYSAQQTGLTAIIITKSGSTITKGGEQFLLNFSNQLSNTRGFINVIMTSATTGIITTIGNRESSNSSVLLYTFSINGSDIITITGQRSIEASFSGTIKGVGLTTLSATSAVITYMETGTNYVARILTLSSGVITAVGPSFTPQPSFNINVAFPQIVALSPTLVVTAYFEQDASPNDLYVVAGSVSGTTITWGTPVLQASATGANTNTHSISRLSATEFIVATTKNATVVSNYGSVSGTTITLGAQNTYTGSSVGGTMSYPISSTSALVVFTDVITGTNKPAAFVLTKSGTSLTRGTTYTLETSVATAGVSTPPFSLKGFVPFNSIQQPSTDFYMDYATTLRVFAVPLSVSGTVVTPVTGVLITPEIVGTSTNGLSAICTLSKTRAIAFVTYNVLSDGTSGSRLHLLDTSGARPVVIATDSSISTAGVFCAGQLSPTRALIAYALNFNTVSTIRTLDITGDVFTFNTAITGTSLIGSRPAIRKISPTKAMLYVANSTTSHRIYNVAISDTTLTESPSFVTTLDNAAQTNASRRILYNYGDVGYFFSFQTNAGQTAIFDVSQVSPQSLLTSANNIGSVNQIAYLANPSAGVMIALASGSSTAYSNGVSSSVDGLPRLFFTQIGPEVNGFGITLPFNANSIMFCGNDVNSYGKLTFNTRFATSTNSSIPNKALVFSPSLAMHEPIQDFVEGDFFAPNTNKLLFFARNSMNFNYEMYHVFDKGAAQ